MSTKSDILAAARQAFEETGEVGLSVRDVAARVGLTPMAIYRHFENKQAMVDALSHEAVEQWRRRVANIAPCEPIQWLKSIGEAYLDFALREPRTFEAAFLVSTQTALRYPDDFIAGGSPVITLQLKLITEITASSKKGGISAVDFMVIIAGLSQGLISLYRVGRIAGDEKKFRALYGRAMETVFRSLTTAHPP